MYENTIFVKAGCDSSIILRYQSQINFKQSLISNESYVLKRETYKIMV